MCVLRETRVYVCFVSYVCVCVCVCVSYMNVLSHVCVCYVSYVCVCMGSF